MNLNTRITIKFLFQIGILFIAMWCIVGIAIGFYYLTEKKAPKTEEINPVIVLQKMPTATIIHGNSIQVAEGMLNKFKQKDAWLQILDSNGQEIYHFHSPKNVPTKYTPGQLVYDKSNPSQFGYQLFTWYGTVNHQSLTWIIGVPQGNSSINDQQHRPYGSIILLFLGSLVTVLIAAFFFGRRMGAPILHMMNWLQNLANQSYFEPTDAKGIPNSKKSLNGSLKKSYKIYREVLAILEHLSAALQQSELERKHLEQTREEWITGITHDLKTPLSSVKGYAHLFEAPDYEWTKMEIREFGKVISEKATYMDELIEDLGLTFRLKHRDLPIKRKEENIVELVRRVVIDLVNHPYSEGQTILFDCGVDKLDYPLDVKWMTRALDNLLFNSSLHNPVNTTISVKVQPIKREDFHYAGARIEIQDNGIGMDKKTVDRLFDRYFRGTNTTKNHVKGSGLGTAIAKQLIEAHDGKILVESILGSGTTIVIELPPKN